MREPGQHIDRLFHEPLSGLGENAPAHVWEGVESALDMEAEAKQRLRTRRNRYALALLFVLMAGSAGVLWEAMDIIDSRSVSASTDPVSLYKLPISGGAVIQRDELSSNEKDQQATTGQELTINRLMLLSSSGNNTTVQQASLNAPIVNIDQSAASNSFVGAQVEKQAIIATEINSPVIAATPVWLTAKTIPTKPLSLTQSPAISSLKKVSKNKLSRFALTAFFAPDITTRNLEQDRGNTADEAKDAIEKAERNSNLDYTYGLRVDYKLNKRFSLQSGISFSTNTIDIADKIVYARYDRFGALRYKFNMSSGYAFAKLTTIPVPQFVGDSTHSSGSTSTLHYMNIPVAVKYNLHTGSRLNVYLHAGITARFITGESISTTYDYHGFRERSISREIEGLKKSYFNGVVGVGAEYALTRHVAVTLFPSFNFATSSINQDAPVKAYPNTVSIASGIKYNF